MHTGNFTMKTPEQLRQFIQYQLDQSENIGNLIKNIGIRAMLCRSGLCFFFFSCSRIFFLLLILFGYVAGITSKFVNEAYMASFAQKWYVLVFYILNFIMVSVDLGMYIRNYNLDKKRAAGESV